jgi:hypothetical protein
LFSENKVAFSIVNTTPSSFFGPDNLPPLEAFALGCPVIASEIPGASNNTVTPPFLFRPPMRVHGQRQ